jgi:signal transduction histidine kinase
MTRRWLDTWLSPLALSNTALAWATLIGGFSTLVLVPGTAGIGVYSWSWLAVAAMSQAIFAILIVAGRAIASRPSPGAVLAILAIGGVARGAVIAVGAGIVGVAPLTATSLVSRSLNSLVISVIGVALIGATLAWREDFRSQYRVLRDRALLLGNGAGDDAVIDPSVIDAWASMKGGLDTTLNAVGERLAAGASPSDMRAAADLLTGAIDQDLRPASRAMWMETIPEDQPLRLRTLFVDTLAQWRLPLAIILGFLTVVVGVGSLVRSGLVAGGAYTLRYIVVTGLILWLSTSLAKAAPRFAPVIAIVTLLCLPPLVLLSDYEIGDVLLGLPEDPTGQILVALQTPVTTLLIAMAVVAVRDRQQVLDALQQRINFEAAIVQQRGSGRDAQRLSVFVHHSVQSELSALALQVREAAITGDPATMDDVRALALERLQRIQDIDKHSPPWLHDESGRDRIDQVVGAWTGILDVTLTLPDDSVCRADQWRLAALVIEEGLANSARHGGASQVRITGRDEDGALVLQVQDDGVTRTPGSGQGLGSQWLDRVAPGDWSRDQTPQGAVLTVKIR